MVNLNSGLKKQLVRVQDLGYTADVAIGVEYDWPSVGSHESQNVS